MTPVGDKDTVYAVVAPPSFTLVGPEIETVIGSLSAIVAVAEDAPELRETCDDSVDVIVPKRHRERSPRSPTARRPSW